MSSSARQTGIVPEVSERERQYLEAHAKRFPRFVCRGRIIAPACHLRVWNDDLGVRTYATGEECSKNCSELPSDLVRPIARFLVQGAKPVGGDPEINKWWRLSKAARRQSSKWFSVRDPERSIFLAMKRARLGGEGPAPSSAVQQASEATFDSAEAASERVVQWLRMYPAIVDHKQFCGNLNQILQALAVETSTVKELYEVWDPIYEEARRQQVALPVSPVAVAERLLLRPRTKVRPADVVDWLRTQYFVVSTPEALASIPACAASPPSAAIAAGDNALLAVLLDAILAAEATSLWSVVMRNWIDDPRAARELYLEVDRALASRLISAATAKRLRAGLDASGLVLVGPETVDLAPGYTYAVDSPPAEHAYVVLDFGHVRDDHVEAVTWYAQQIARSLGLVDAVAGLGGDGDEWPVGRGGGTKRQQSACELAVPDDHTYFAYLDPSGHGLRALQQPKAELDSWVANDFTKQDLVNILRHVGSWSGRNCGLLAIEYTRRDNRAAPRGTFIPKWQHSRTNKSWLSV